MMKVAREVPMPQGLSGRLLCRMNPPRRLCRRCSTTHLSGGRCSGRHGAYGAILTLSEASSKQLSLCLVHLHLGFAHRSLERTTDLVYVLQVCRSMFKRGWLKWVAGAAVHLCAAGR